MLKIICWSTTKTVYSSRPIILLFESSSPVLDMLNGLKLGMDLFPLILRRFPGTLFIDFLLLFLLLLHSIIVIHCFESKVFHSEVSDRLDQLSQRETSVNLLFFVCAEIHWLFIFHLLLNLRVIVILLSHVGVELLFIFRRRQRRIDRFYQSSIIWPH